MRARTHIFALLLCVAAAVGMAGCRRNIVRAAPPSVTTPPPPETPPQPTVPVTSAESTPTEPPAVTSAPAPAPTVKPAQPRPRPPAEPEAPKPKVEPEPAPAPPQIAPQLSPRQLADAQRRTSADIVTAEKNLQLATGKQLNATQTDLKDKVQGFLGEAHDAIRTSDWVRAQNLAHKAQILSTELAKSL